MTGSTTSPVGSPAACRADKPSSCWAAAWPAACWHSSASVRLLPTLRAVSGTGRRVSRTRSAVAATAPAAPALLRVYRMAAPAPAAVSAVAATARVAPALILVFRRMLPPVTPASLSLAAAHSAAACVSETFLVQDTAVVAALPLPVQPPATVLPGSSAGWLSPTGSVLRRARGSAYQGLGAN
jgi:hypothetical protein